MKWHPRAGRTEDSRTRFGQVWSDHVSEPLTNRNGRVFVVLCLIAVFQLVTIVPGMVGSEDAALYLLHARNIAFGRPYLATGYIYTVETARYSPRGYPPVFPMMLAPLFRISGTAPRPYKTLMACIFVLCLFVIALLYRKKLRHWQLLLLVVLLGINPYLTQEKNEILSDLPFVLFLYTAFVLVERQLETDPESPYLLRGILAGVFSYLAYGTRVIGAGIILALIAYGLLRRRMVTRFLIIVVLTFGILAGLQLAFVPIHSDYLRLLYFKEHSPRQNLHFYAGVTSYLWDAGLGAVARLPIFFTTMCISAVGALRRISRSWDVATVFSVGYGIFIIFWPYHQARYLLPIIPVYLYYLVCGLESLHRLLVERSQTAARIMVWILTTLLLVSYASKYAHSGLAGSFEAWDSPPKKEIYALIQASTPKDAVILARTPRALALYTDRRTVQFPENADSESLRRYIAKSGATYVLLPATSVTQWKGWRLLEIGAEPVFSTANYGLYKTARGKDVITVPPANN